MKKVAILIPAYNESSTIGDIVKKVKKFGDVIVVDDGSIDNTLEAAKNNGAIVVKNKLNQGYDKSLIDGFKFAKQKKYSFVITIDADGQHPVDKISNFLHDLDNGSDLVIGYRNKNARFSELLFSYFGKKIWGINDPLCGMKAYNTKIFSSNFFKNLIDSIGSEVSIKAIKLKYKYSQIPIFIKERSDSSRFGSGFRVNFHIFKVLIKLLLKYR